MHSSPHSIRWCCIQFTNRGSCQHLPCLPITPANPTKAADVCFAKPSPSFGRLFNEIGTGSSIPRRFAGSSTRPKYSSNTKAITIARALLTRSKWPRWRARSPGVLGLNTDLSETVALAHDLGHPPFGHTGEDVLNRCMEGNGGFDHNAQALRVVTFLERHYPGFDGLNLTWETLEGIAKHNGPVVNDLPRPLAEYTALHDLELHTHASAEAQVAALADDIAYNAHDLDDGLRAGLFTEDDVLELPIVGPALPRSTEIIPGSMPSGDGARHCVWSSITSSRAPSRRAASD